jgi:hypothetical protein
MLLNWQFKPEFMKKLDASLVQKAVYLHANVCFWLLFKLVCLPKAVIKQRKPGT